MISSMENNVIVTAHPDDEVLWASSLPIRYKEAKWTIICCSVPRHDSIRAWKFFDACEVLGVTPRLIPSVESSPDQFLTHLDVIDLSPYDLVVTHNDEGEYGHLHHQCVHDYVINNWSNKKIWTFGYRKSREGEIRIELTAEEYFIKLKALKKYDHLWPYNGKNIPKWEALIHRYQNVEGIDFSTETFDEYKRTR